MDEGRGGTVAMENQTHAVSPFGIDKVMPKRFTRKGKEIEVADTDGGEVMLLRSRDSVKEGVHDYGSYIKVFKPEGLLLFYGLSKTALYMVGFIMENIKPGSDVIDLRVSVIVRRHKELSGGSFYRAVSELTGKKVIAKCKNGKYAYYLNTNIFFNGDRRRIKVENGK